MWIYAHWNTNGSTYIQPFHRQDKAAEHAFSRIASYVASDTRSYGNKNMPKELTMLKVEMDRLADAKTMDNAMKIIAMYEEYLQLVVGQVSPYHDIRDVKMVE